MKSRILTLLIIVVVTVFSYNSQAQTTYIVTNTNNSGVGSLRVAIASAAASDIIRFSPSLIASGSDSIVLASELLISKGLIIKGLYNSTDTLFISGGNICRIFYVDLASSTDKNLELDSLVLINGNGLGATNTGKGGAICFYNGDNLIINNSIISHNSSSSDGGGVYSYSSIFSNISIDKSIIKMNITTNGSGGGVCSQGGINGSSPAKSSITISNSTLSNNNSKLDGAGIKSMSTSFSTVLIEKSVVSGNNSSTGNGGGIYSGSYYSYSILTVNNCSITNNSASTGGGCVSGSASGSGATPYSNTPYYASIEATNSTISNNMSSNIGGGIRIDGSYSTSTVTITNCTISGNNSNGNSGGGIWARGQTSNPTIKIKSSIVGLNGSSNIYTTGTSITSQGYNIFDDAPNGYNASTDQINIDSPTLSLQPLGFYGGTTQIMPPAITSVAIDMGTPTDMSNAQNGLIIGGRRDVGAAEYVFICTPTFSSLSATICQGANYSFGGQNYNTAGVYKDTLLNAAGCDSIITLNLSIGDLLAPVANVASLSNITSQCSVTSLTAPTATDNCAGTITGTHNATLPITTQGTTTVTWTYDDGNGNTTTQTQDIVIDDITNPVANVASLSNITSECSVTSLIAPTATDNCAGSITATHNATLPITTQGTTTVTWTYDDGNGNTTTQTQSVVITPIDNGVTQIDALTLSANAVGYDYQWVDCNNGNQAINGETGQTFTATANGSYAVVIDNGTCSVTSNCTVINQVGIVENSFSTNLIVYPNPTKGSVSIDFGTINEQLKTKLFSTNGQLISSKNYNNTSLIQLDIPQPAGIYILVIEGENGEKASLRIIKE